MSKGGAKSGSDSKFFTTTKKGQIVAQSFPLSPAPTYLLQSKRAQAKTMSSSWNSILRSQPRRRMQ
jgi:hypothetical protein